MTIAIAPASQRTPDVRVTIGGVIRSEWTKFRSLRSTYLMLLASVVLTIGLGALISAVTANQWDNIGAKEKAVFDAVSTSLNGVRIAELVIGVLGVLFVSSEYSTGMIRATLTAVPARTPVFVAKLIVFTSVTFVLSVISSFVAFFVGQILLSTKNLDTTLSAPGAFRMVFGSALFVVVVGILGIALGTILRNTAAGISTLVAVLFVIPPLIGLLPKSVSNTIGPYLPSNAGEALWVIPDGKALSPWAGFVVMCVWAVVACAGAIVVLRRRDV